jgi:hypothetical protein
VDDDGFGGVKPRKLGGEQGRWGLIEVTLTGPQLGRVLKVVHDGVDRVPIERSLVVEPVLKHALRHLRFVKSQQPSDADSVEFADWRERVAGALDALACALVFEEDRARARAEAAAALEQAAEVRRRREIGASER